MKPKLELFKMPNLNYTHEGIHTSRRANYIVINDVIVERITERFGEDRYDYDTRLMTRVAVFEDALKVKARKTRGV
jgi:hypothetical protein